ncbi:phosphatidylserine decarboxylase-domain-containing protein [Zopfochytrium polystomum]|nr:phosphatidylserine decarboxylase-domain-containing protein [Zopfochytrium polystomum]
MPTLVSVLVVGARNLASRDRAAAACDPFVIVKLGETQTHKTPVVQKNANPVWNFECKLVVTPLLLDAFVTIHCWHKCTVPIAEVISHSFTDPKNRSSWLVLQARNSKDRVSGEILLKTGFAGDLTDELRQMQQISQPRRLSQFVTPMSSGDIFQETVSADGRSEEQLNVTRNEEAVGASIQSLSAITDHVLVDGADSLPKDLLGIFILELVEADISAPDFPGQHDTFTVIGAGKKRFRTKIQMRTSKPVWNERALINVYKEDLENNMKLTLSIYSQDDDLTQTPAAASVILIKELVSALPSVKTVSNMPTQFSVLSKTINLINLSKFRTSAPSTTPFQIKYSFMRYEDLRRNTLIFLLSVFDSNKDGFINQVELTTALDCVGSTLSDDSISMMFADSHSSDREEVETEIEAVVAMLIKRLQTQQESHAWRDEYVLQIVVCPLCRKLVRYTSDMEALSHIAFCSLDSTSKVGQFLLGGLTTNVHTTGRWFSKILSADTYGEVWRNNGSILVKDRLTKQVVEERIPIFERLGIRLMYHSASSRGSRDKRAVTNLLSSLSVNTGRNFDDPSSRDDISAFIAQHNIAMDDVQLPLSSFKTFNEFFYRKLKPEARKPASNDATVFLSPTDSRMSCFSSAIDAANVWVKGARLNIRNLLWSDELADDFAEGSIALFRLAPQDYHRFHAPISSKLVEHRLVAGTYQTLHSLALRSSGANNDLLSANTRTVTVLQPVGPGALPGRYCMVCIGSLLVGSIVHTAASAAEMQWERMEEMGYFAFGGSTVVLLFPKGWTVDFDKDLMES